ncbi:chemotaxis protein CheB [Candidatus Nitrospira bockiana]
MDRARRTGEPAQQPLRYGIIAMASSAGGVKALVLILQALPGDLGLPVVLVQHLDPHHPSLMAGILSRRTPLSVKEAQEGEQLESNRVYVAPPDHHLLVNPDHTLSLSHAELVNFVRPSADLLFESVAASYKERAIAVVLTGSGSDGVGGVGAIKKIGGVVIAQDPKDSEFLGMPAAAIATGTVDLILPLQEIPRTLIRLVHPAETA